MKVDTGAHGLKWPPSLTTVMPYPRRVHLPSSPDSRAVPSRQLTRTTNAEPAVPGISRSTAHALTERRTPCPAKPHPLRFRAPSFAEH
jgi:hypothetical protein